MVRALPLEIALAAGVFLCFRDGYAKPRKIGFPVTIAKDWVSRIMKETIENESGERIQRKRHKKKRFYFYRVGIPKREYAVLLFCSVLSLLIVGILISYCIDYHQSRAAMDLLRQDYYQDSTTYTADSVQNTPYITERLATAPDIVETAMAPQMNTPYISNTYILQDGNYPNNPHRVIDERILRLRKRNSDIVGWLTIEGVLDEAVVQRDNTYYLNRDYLGYHNVNGALFLDERCSLYSRPKALVIYGHNMKNGSMFGSLHYYEKLSYYKEHCFISCLTLYEESRFVIVAVSRVSVLSGSIRNTDYQRLSFCGNRERNTIINKILAMSRYDTRIDISSDDQILILSTCIGNDNERLLVMARQIRDNEDLPSLQKTVSTTYLK